MIIVNTPTVPNKAITEVHGIARGSTVRARNVGSDIFAGLKNIVGETDKKHSFRKYKEVSLKTLF